MCLGGKYCIQVIIKQNLYHIKGKENTFIGIRLSLNDSLVIFHYVNLSRLLLLQYRIQFDT